MRKTIRCLMSLILLSWISNGYGASNACEADGLVEFLCGPVSPEDLAQIPGTPWIIASGMEDAARLSEARRLPNALGRQMAFGCREHCLLAAAPRFRFVLWSPEWRYWVL